MVMSSNLLFVHYIACFMLVRLLIASICIFLPDDMMLIVVFVEASTNGFLNLTGCCRQISSDISTSCAMPMFIVNSINLPVTISNIAI